MAHTVTVEKLEKFIGSMATRLLVGAGLEGFSVGGNPVGPDTIASSSYLLPSVIHRADMLCRVAIDEPFNIVFNEDQDALLGCQVDVSAVSVADSVFLAFCRGAIDEAVQNHLTVARRNGVDIAPIVPIDDLVAAWGEDVSAGLIQIRRASDIDAPRPT